MKFQNSTVTISVRNTAKVANSGDVWFMQEIWIIFRSRTYRRISDHKAKGSDVKCNTVGCARVNWHGARDVPENEHR